MSERTYIIFQQSYMFQIYAKQTGFEACFNSKCKSRNFRNFKHLFTLIDAGKLTISSWYFYYKCFAFCGTLMILHFSRMSRSGTHILLNARINVTATARRRMSVVVCNSFVCSVEVLVGVLPLSDVCYTLVPISSPSFHPILAS